MSHRTFRQVLDCGSPLPLSSPLRTAKPAPKRQGTGAVQDAAVIREGAITLRGAHAALSSVQRSVSVFLTIIAGAVQALAQPAFPTLTNQHVDLLIVHDMNAARPLALAARNDDAVPPVTYASNEVVLVATEASQFTMPFDFPELGLSQEQTFWWLRQSSPPAGTLLLGFAAEGIPGGTFTGPLSVYITEVEGPGGFFIWQDLSLGGVNLLVDSRDGLDGNDVVPVFTTGHDHYNWAFESNGVYCVTFRVEGILTAGGSASSLETTFVFHVQPLGVVTPFVLWQKVYWLQGTSALTNGPGADPENDGLCNAIEYSSQLDPTSFTMNHRPTFSLTTNGPDAYGAWTFRRIKSVSDVAYEPAATSLLHPPTWEILTNQVSVVDEGRMETVTLRDHRAVSVAPTRFLQHRVRLNQP